MQACHRWKQHKSAFIKSSWCPVPACENAHFQASPAVQHRHRPTPRHAPTHAWSIHSRAIFRCARFLRHRRPTHPRARRPEDISRRSVCRTLGAAQRRREEAEAARRRTAAEFARQLEEDIGGRRRRLSAERRTRSLRDCLKRTSARPRRPIVGPWSKGRKGAALGRSPWRESIESASAVNARTRPSARLVAEPGSATSRLREKVGRRAWQRRGNGGKDWVLWYIPWPVFENVRGVEDVTRERVQDGEAQAKSMHSELLRWHPDKFNGKVPCKVVEGDREAGQRGMSFVSWRGDAVVFNPL